MPGHFYINGRFLSQKSTGVQRYAIELVRSLDSMIASGDIKSGSFTILSPRNLCRILELEHIPIKPVGRFSGHLWEQLELPFYARGGFLISLCNTAPLVKRQQAVTIHDAGIHAVPDSYAFAFRSWYRFLWFWLGKTVSLVLTVSEFSKNEIARRIGVASSRIRAIYHGSEHIASAQSDDSIIKRERLSHRPFILAVSSLSPRKNFSAVMKAVDHIGDTDFDIVIAGSANPQVFGKTAARLPGNIKYLGYVNDSQLKSLYSHAAAFIYPSLYEGFGLPPLEAMTCGCPVIVSDIPPHREVCGEAALYCDPDSPEDIAEKIQRVISDATLRQKLVSDGRNRAENFNWHKSAGQFYDAIQETLSSQNR